MEKRVPFLKLPSKREERFPLCQKEYMEPQNSKTWCLDIVYIHLPHLCKLALFPIEVEEVDREKQVFTIPVENVGLRLLPGQEYAFAYQSSKCACEHYI